MKIFLLLLFSFFTLQTVLSAANSIHEFEMPDIEGNPVHFSDFKGQVLLIVNTASRCGFTRQYEDLVQLQNDLGGQRFTVLGFPANNFGNQEPGSNEEIAQFCEERFGVNFPMFSRTSVRGRDISPLFEFLISAENPDFTGNIRWNFEKILVGPDGTVLRRFRSRVSPNSPTIRNAIAEALNNL
jgi:glutathione peroxidase